MSGFDKILRGNIVLENEVMYGEIGVNDEKITLITDEIGVHEGTEVIDVGDSYIFPGIIDVHVHCFSNTNEGFTLTSRAAAVGGVTTFLYMPYDVPDPINNVDIFREKVDELNGQSVVDVALWATIAKTGGVDQIKPLAEAGAIAFKMSTFETDEHRFPRIPDYEVLKAFDEIRETGLLAAFHSENDDVIVELTDEYKRSGFVYPRAHMETRPPLTETTAVLKLLEFAYWTNVKLHIVHVSHPRTIELINYFAQQGVNVTAETCYNYLLLTDKDLEKHGPMAKINPPLRVKEDVEGMWNHLQQNHIDLISSDHAPWEYEKKIAGKDNIFRSTSGLPGLEIMVPLLFSEGVLKGKMTPLQFARLMSQHPAEVFQIKNKGKISTGFDADFTIIDPKTTWTIDSKQFQSYSKLSPYDGKHVQGKIKYTIVRGEVVYDGVNIKVDPGYGQFVAGKAKLN